MRRLRDYILSALGGFLCFIGLALVGVSVIVMVLLDRLVDFMDTGRNNGH